MNEMWVDRWTLSFERTNIGPGGFDDEELRCTVLDGEDRVIGGATLSYRRLLPEPPDLDLAYQYAVATHAIRDARRQAADRNYTP